MVTITGEKRHFVRYILQCWIIEGQNGCMKHNECHENNTIKQAHIAAYIVTMFHGD